MRERERARAWWKVGEGQWQESGNRETARERHPRSEFSEGKVGGIQYPKGTKLSIIAAFV